jgi:hypothetical protein
MSMKKSQRNPRIERISPSTARIREATARVEGISGSQVGEAAIAASTPM